MNNFSLKRLDLETLFRMYPKHIREYLVKYALHDALIEDALFLRDKDPSVKYIDYVFFRTELAAITAHRVSKSSFTYSNPFTNDLWQTTKSISGIDIHPNAKIGVPFAIDHGTGTVIGETAEIGKRCFLYHGVTLGAKNYTFEPRHPVLGDNVTIGCNSTILGRVIIPSDTFIKANSFIVEE